MNSLPASGLALWISWLCRLAAAVILLQTLCFKFTGAEESVYIFTRLGIEPWGRIGTGIAELAAAILILTPRFSWVGGLFAMLLMTGAIISHLAVLGLVVRNDGGLLFALAVTVWLCGAATAWLHHFRVPCGQHARGCPSGACELPKARS